MTLARLTTSLIVFLATALPAFAQNNTTNATNQTTGTDGSQIGTIVNTVMNILTFVRDMLFDFSAILTLGVIVIAGMYYISGNVDTAKKAITAGIIGLIIVASAWAIVGLVVRYTPQG